ncbi:MAG: tetratricopeptide repeat protein [Myxococcota bacterium]
MNIWPQSTTRHLIAMLALLFAATSFWGCKKQTKEDEEPTEQKVEKAEIEKMAEETGMDVSTLEAFQDGSAEMKKAEPDMAKAAELFEQVIEAEPTFAEAHYNLGIAYSKMNQHEKAAEHFEVAREIEPEVLDHTVALAQAYAVNEEYSRAATLFEEVVARQPENLTAKNNLAILALRDGDVEEAMGHVRDVLREDNQNVGALNTLGLIYSQRDNMSLAKYVFQKAIRISYCESEPGETEESAEEQVQEDLEESPEEEAAEEDDQPEQKEKCVKRPDPDVHNNLGMVFMQEDNVPNAVNQFRAAIEANPNYLESRLNLGAILIEYLDYERAGNQFTEAVRIAPNNCTAHLGLGAAKYGAAEFESAADNYKYYVDKCDADHKSSYQRLAKLYESQLDDPKQSITYYEKLIELEDDEKKVENYNAMINFLKSQVESKEQKEPEEDAADEGAEDAPSEGEGEEGAEDAPAEDEGEEDAVEEDAGE